MLAIRPSCITSAMRALANESLFLRDDPAHPQVLRRDGAVGLLAADDVALLGAEHMHGFGAIGRDSERLAGGHHGFPKSQAVPAGCPELVGELAGESDPVRTHGHARSFTLANCHEGEALRINSQFWKERRDDLA